jgi:isoquinoline 1-oxidoreductase alpha subunit
MSALHVNGRDHTVDADPGTPILWALRDTLGMTGTKFGCGAALCGACTVHLDGQAIRSCITPISAAEGKKITTIEATTDGSDPPARPCMPRGSSTTSRSAATARAARS